MRGGGGVNLIFILYFCFNIGCQTQIAWKIWFQAKDYQNYMNSIWSKIDCNVRRWFILRRNAFLKVPSVIFPFNLNYKAEHLPIVVFFSFLFDSNLFYNSILETCLHYLVHCMVIIIHFQPISYTFLANGIFHLKWSLKLGATMDIYVRIFDSSLHISMKM